MTNGGRRRQGSSESTNPYSHDRVGRSNPTAATKLYELGLTTKDDRFLSEGIWIEGRADFIKMKELEWNKEHDSKIELRDEVGFLLDLIGPLHERSVRNYGESTVKWNGPPDTEWVGYRVFEMITGR